LVEGHFLGHGDRGHPQQHQPEDQARNGERHGHDVVEAAEQARILASAAPPDETLTTASAAQYIGLSTDALLRARRAGRIVGVRLNEKDWGFRRSALDKYPRRRHRPTT